MSVDVSVIVVSYNTRELLRECLLSLQRETDGVSYEVVVVDNASEDGSAAMVPEAFPEISLLALDTNVGFARANNLAAERARGSYLLLLNPDTVVLGGAVQRLVEFARRHPDAGVYGGRTLREDGSVDPSSCWGAPSLWSLTCFAVGLSGLFPRSRLFDPESLGRWERDSVRHVDVVAGCLLLMDGRLWRELGGFDSRFFMYGEDFDLCLRAGRLGYRPTVTPDATIVHLLGASSDSRPDRKQLVLKAKVTLMTKHWSRWRAGLGRALLVFGVSLRAAGERVWQITNRGTTWGLWDEVWRRRAVWLHPFAPTG